MASSDPRARLPRALVTVAIRWPGPMLLAWGTFVLLCAVGALGLRIDTSTDSVLDRRSPEWQVYRQSLTDFGGDELLVVAIASEQPLSRALLTQVRSLTAALEQVEGVRRVDSLATVALIRSTPEGSLDLTAAIERGVPESEAARARLASLLKKDRIAQRSLISEDGRVAAINVLLEDQLAGSFDDVIAGVRSAVDRYEARISGVPIFRTEINTRTGAEITFFAGLTVLLVGGLLYFVFGSLMATAVPLAAGGIGTATVLGAMGAGGIPLTLMTMILPSIMLALGCAYATHVVRAAMGAPERAALEERVGAVALAVAASGLTTAIGFVAMAVVPIDAIRQVGGLGALGVLTTTAAALLFAPAVAALRPLPAVATPFGLWIEERAGSGLLMLASRHRFAIRLSAAALAVGFGLGLVWLRLETDAVKWFPKNSQIRADYDGIGRDLSGISPINIVVRADKGERVTRPDIVAALAQFTQVLEARAGVGKALSLADPLWQTHEQFTDRPEVPLPDSQALNEQYLLLLESVDAMRDLVTFDHTAANVPLRVDDNGSAYLLDLADFAERWWTANAPADTRAQATGVMFEFARAEDEIARGQIRGLTLAVVGIGLVLLFLLRSPRLALVSLIPNLVPIAVAFGAMGWLGVPLDAGTVLVGNLALGIAVDDTVHLVSAFHDGRRSGGAPEVALAGAFQQSLTALSATTLALGLGFSVLAFSSFSFTRNLGVLTAVIMILCFLADVLLLPALLLGRSRAKSLAPVHPRSED